APAIVAGRPRGEHGARVETSRNPARLEDVVCEVALGTGEAVLAACRAAAEPQRRWAATPAPVRARAVQLAGRLVEANKERLARLGTREIGKPHAESLGAAPELTDPCPSF